MPRGEEMCVSWGRGSYGEVEVLPLALELQIERAHRDRSRLAGQSQFDLVHARVQRRAGDRFLALNPACVTEAHAAIERAQHALVSGIGEIGSAHRGWP